MKNHMAVRTSTAATDRCVAFTSDQNYAFPTLVAALQARQHLASEAGEILICLFGVDHNVEDILRAVCEQENLKLLAIPPEAIEGASPMMARLFLDRFIPDRYRHILYLDGDVQIKDSLTPLLNANVPTGHFLAVSDPATFLIDDNGRQSRELRDHLFGLGLNNQSAASYFNSGMLRINRDGWNAIGSEAWRLISKRASRFRFPDQDPLNIVAAGAHISISLRWNFPIFMRNARVEKIIKPSVYHFMSNPKPWQGVYAPWNANFSAPYRNLIVKYPALRSLSLKLDPQRRLMYYGLQFFKKSTETFTWGYSCRRQRVLQYEQRVAAALLMQKSD